MKRLLIGSLMLLAVGTTAFAGIHHRREEPREWHRHHYSKNIERADNCRRSFEFRKMEISIDEKRLEIRKELLNDKPDWNKVQKLNDDIALERSKYKTDLMRERFERQTRRMESPLKSEAPIR